MAIHMSVHSSLASASASGIRVVVCEPQPELRSQLRSFLDADTLLMLVAETSTRSECEAALQEFDPELLIARADLIPPQCATQGDQDARFPVVIALPGPVA